MEPARKQEEPQPVERPVDRDRITDKLAEIADLARRRPEDYLEQTRTPGGGE